MKSVKKIVSGGSVSQASPLTPLRGEGNCGQRSQASGLPDSASGIPDSASGLPSPRRGAGGEAVEAVDYEGIPYQDIVKRLLQRWGIYGEPAQGARNSTLYRLAREVRYICDFSVPYVLQVIPSWGLGEQERQQTVSSAVGSPRGTRLPADIEAVITELRREGEDGERTETPQNVAEQLNPLPRLPRLIDFFVRRNPRNERAVVLATLPILGNLLCRLRSRYLDGTMESPIFMSVIVGPQASGKSFLRDIYETLGAPMLEADREQLRKEREYKDKVRKAKNAKQQPELEEFTLRCLPATISNTQLLRRVDQNHGLSILSFAPEIDTLKRANSSGAWAQKGDIYRIGFEAGQYGQDYAAENSYSATVELRYNLLLSGTDAAVRSFFKNVENGMVSRFCFAQMADDRGMKVQQRPQRIGALTREKVIDMARELFEMGSNPDPDALVYVSLPRTLKALDQWTEQRIAEYMQTGNAALDILRRRSCLIGFRAAMVGWALCGGSEKTEVVNLALWVATEVLNQQLALYGKMLNEQEGENRRIREEGQNELRRSRNTRLLDELGETFSKGDVATLRAEHGMQGECSYIITRWIGAGLIMRRPDGVYQKIKK